MDFVVLVTLLLGVLWVSLYLIRRMKPGHSMPPSPPADPLIGHMRMIPEHDAHLFFHELSKKYGKIISLRVPRRTLIILNSAKAAVDLLEKRSSVYSDRPSSDVMSLMGFVSNLVFFPYGENFRRHRRLLNEYFHQKKCISYQGVQEQEAHRLIHSLEASPEKFEDHLNRYSASIILNVAHGHQVQGEDDEYMKIAEAVEYAITHCAPPGSNFVDMFPFLKNMPSWIPGTFAATQARLFRPAVDRMHDYPFEDAKRKQAAGSSVESLLSCELEKINREGENYMYSAQDVKGATAVVYIAGADTTFCTLLIFMLAMVLYPEAQIKAQEELDRLTGGTRLPTFEDRNSLPYLENLVQETYRWHSSVPSGIPHRCMEDDIYEGMFIPKGSIVIANTHAMMRDEDVYREPDKFDPGRYDRGEPYPVSQFGFGRRICPGRHLADASVFIAIASILAVYRVEPITDNAGKPILPPEEFESAITSRPKPFKCHITPRNKELITSQGSGLP
ncbi:cytochrome P450 [Agrocybe pediades]|nr:cytochrome P450 [Agrocybe pediades]